LSSIALCKDKHANEYFKHNGKMIPLRHLAPEVLKTFTFSTASDIFACGLTIWEVFNFGALPFDNISNEEFLQMVQNNSVDYGKLFETGMPSEIQKTLVR
jgi:serine/threonine protein kinase